MKERAARAAVSIVLAVLAACAAAPAAAEPRLEIGAGAIALRVPDYRGSDRSEWQAYPVPYVTYRSDKVQLTREGLRARLFALDRLTASASGAIVLTGRANNPDRAGMPKLKPALEFGPSLDWLLGSGGNWMLRARLPVRAALSVDGFRWLGATAIPHLRLDYDQDLGRSDLFYLASLGALWGSSEYHQYYYGVPLAYATAARPAYEAHSGYSGARLTLSTNWRYERFRIGLFGSADSLAGATFEDSPLVKRDFSVSGGLFFSYLLYTRGTIRAIEESP